MQLNVKFENLRLNTIKNTLEKHKRSYNLTHQKLALNVEQDIIEVVANGEKKTLEFINGMLKKSTSRGIKKAYSITPRPLTWRRSEISGTLGQGTSGLCIKTFSEEGALMHEVSKTFTKLNERSDSKVLSPDQEIQSWSRHNPNARRMSFDRCTEFYSDGIIIIDPNNGSCFTLYA